MSIVGTLPAWSTGHFSVRYWPGGRRAGSNPAARTLSSAFERKSGMGMHTKCMDVAQREREFVGVRGPDAADYLQRMVSNRSEEHTSELQSRFDLVCRLLLEKKK